MLEKISQSENSEQNFLPLQVATLWHNEACSEVFQGEASLVEGQSLLQQKKIRKREKGEAKEINKNTKSLKQPQILISTHTRAKML